MAKIAINGLGRVGRAAFKILHGLDGVEVAAVNDLVPADNLAYLLTHDTVHGRFGKSITAVDDALVVDEFILRPGEVRDVVRKSASATTAIGVLAGYRDLGKSVWRAVYRLPVAPDASWYRAVIPDKTQQLHVRFDRNVVSISKSE